MEQEAAHVHGHKRAIVEARLLHARVGLHLHHKAERFALNYASQLHRGDSRINLDGGWEPYASHPMRVALYLRLLDVTDSVTIQAAFLHDTVEDHAADIIGRFDLTAVEARRLALDELTRLFGAEVAHVVALVSNPILPAGSSAAEKRGAYVAHVLSAVAQDERAFAVKLADVEDNAGRIVPGITDVRRARFLARKYQPVVDGLIEHLNGVSEKIIPGSGREKLSDRLYEIKSNLAYFVSQA